MTKVQDLKGDYDQLKEKLAARDREIQIEKSLEKVRRIALRMKSPEEMLLICKEISRQLSALGVSDIRNVQTAIFYPSRGTYMNYEYYARHDQTFVTETVYTNHRVTRAFAKKMLEGRGKNYTSHILGDKVKDWISYQKTTNVFIDKYLKTASSLHYYWFSLGPVALGISTYAGMTKEGQALFNQFLKVFQMAYARYLDIERAMAQAREREIQLALERVRARTMAMQNSEELSEVVYLLFTQFGKLGENPDQATIGIIKEKERLIEYWVTMYKKPIARVFRFSIDEPNVTKKIFEGWKARKKSIVIDLSGKALREFSRYRARMGGAKYNPKEKRRMVNVAFFSKGLLNVQSTQARSEESLKLLERFAQVFDQTYTRFLDLKKAEAQAWEARIEAAIERVRSRAMAMHASPELKEVARELRAQVSLLGQKELETCAIHLWDASTGHFEGWAALRSPDNKGEIIESESSMDIRGIRILEESFKRYVSGEKDYVLVNDVARAREFFGALKTVDPRASGFLSRTLKNKRPNDICAFWTVSDFKGGSLVMVTMNPPEEESRKLLKRFAAVFGMAYQRYLDIKRAESQTREAEIQLALERVRARTMAMQKSEELAEAATLLFQQVKQLGIKTYSSGFNIWDEKNGQLVSWMSNPAGVLNPPFVMPLTEYSQHSRFYKAWKNKVPFLEDDLTGARLKKHYQYLRSFPLLDQAFATSEKMGFHTPDRQVHNATFFSHGYLLFITLEPSPAHHDIFKRFGRVFEQTYTRFLDLKRAEAQAREAQIEAALERVRSRAMAMQKSDELTDLVATLFRELNLLEFGLTRCFIHILNPETLGLQSWTANLESREIPQSYSLPYLNIPYYKAFVKAWKGKKKRFVYELGGTEKMETDKVLLNDTEYGNFPEVVKAGMKVPDRVFLSYAFNKYGALQTGGLQPLEDENLDILARFAKVFEQNYARFLDLQKAEAQAREAQIEAALERVRSRSMGMQKSEELHEVIKIVYQQLIQLNIRSDHAGFVVDYVPGGDWTFWIADEQDIPSKITHPHFESVWASQFEEAIQTGAEYFKTHLNFEEKNQFYQKLLSYVPGLSKKARDFYLTCPGLEAITVMGKDVSLYIENFTGIPYGEEHINILIRFGKVFQQTYTRFLDLQKAEVQAREAQIEAALEKVRSRTLAMQKSGELAETAAALFQQLIYLGIEPNRLYIGILQENSGEIEFWITGEDGSRISTMFKGVASKNASIKKMLDAWSRHQRTLVIEMKGKELSDYFHYLGEELHVPFKGGLSQKIRWQYLAFFSRGFIGMASPDEQPESTLQLLERFASVFNLTFTRFNDLKLAEAHALQAELDLEAIKIARKNAEEALAELRATQKQLIQSEKMASLGELTAGIAHEIQNPLNFVNNFSEVNKEMLLEMKDEMNKGNIKEANEIADDIIANSDKINHHGKRAEAIVKSMLEHSRITSGTKELTDINKLADEYLRLAYHGLRAKDKSFNSSLETHFDESISKINIVPQDIGRVLLNLINNAFYATNEKARRNILGYEPKVIVSTSKNDRKIEINVKDNGIGIPEMIKSKIFQPFFTTKPTGSGTGLGLSLSYDIINAHGGRIHLNSKEGEGTEFIIELPA